MDGGDEEEDYEYGDDEDLEDEHDEEQEYVQVPPALNNSAGGSLKISIPFFSSVAKIPK